MSEILNFGEKRVGGCLHPQSAGLAARTRPSRKVDFVGGPARRPDTCSGRRPRSIRVCRSASSQLKHERIWTKLRGVK